MTVKELIELNQMITDCEITVRDNGLLVDQLNIGCARGRKAEAVRRDRWADVDRGLGLRSCGDMKGDDKE